MNDVIEKKEKEKTENKKEVVKKKRGRKPKNERVEYELNQEQTKFFVDLSKEKEVLTRIFSLLTKVNKKKHGREITFKDLAIFGIDKITEKDLDRIREGSLSEMEKVEKALDEYNMKNKLSLSMGEFLVKKLSIS